MAEVRACDARARNRPIPIWPANNTDDATPGTVPCCPQDHAFTMHTKVDDVHTLDELRQFIHKTLCKKENLLADQFTMSEVRLTSGSGPCGLQFCLRGPRNVAWQRFGSQTGTWSTSTMLEGRITPSCGSRTGWRCGSMDARHRPRSLFQAGRGLIQRRCPLPQRGGNLSGRFIQ